MAALAPALTWSSVIGRLGAAEANASFRIPSDSIAHPLDEGMEQLSEASDGSYFDYARRICEGTWLVARQYADAYDVWIIQLEAASTALVKKGRSNSALARSFSSSFADFPAEAPGLTVGVAAALGALGGACAGGGKGAAVGAIIATGAALAAVAVSNAASSPETAQVAQNLFMGLTSAASAGSSSRRAVSSPAPPRPARSASSRGDRFDRADFEPGRRRTTRKK